MLVAVILHFVTKKIILKSLLCIVGNLGYEIWKFFACGILNPELWNPEFSSRDPESR